MLSDEEKAAVREMPEAPCLAVWQSRGPESGFLKVIEEVAEWLGFSSVGEYRRALRMNPAWMRRHIKERP